MKGVILSINPKVRLIDLTHEIPSQDIAGAAFTLLAAYRSFPAGTVHVAVVDPGVGSARRPILAMAGEQYFVGPDNGIFSYLFDREPDARAFHLTEQSYFHQPVSATFHGRDIFSPAAAHLVYGWDFNLVGPEVSQLVRLTPKASVTSEKGIEGNIIGLDDPYGSLITDIPGDEFKKLGYTLGDKIRIEINRKPATLPYVKTFMDVPVGDLLLYVDSRGRVGIAVNEGNYSKKFDVTPPGTIFIPRKGAPFKGK